MLVDVLKVEVLNAALGFKRVFLTGAKSMVVLLSRVINKVVNVNLANFASATISLTFKDAKILINLVEPGFRLFLHLYLRKLLLPKGFTTLHIFPNHLLCFISKLLC